VSKQVAILCIHGVGHGDVDADLRPSWIDAISSSLRRWDAGIDVDVDFLTYDDLFDHAPLSAVTYTEAVAKLLASGVIHSAGDLFTRPRGLVDFPQQVRWTAGMVAQWATEDDLRQATRQAVLNQLKTKSYDAVCAHSLGSLIGYDTFSRTPEAIEGKVFVSFGSQIANPFVRDTFAGRIEALAASKWYHLYNPDDHVFTAQIVLNAPNFEQDLTEFDIPNDPINHDAAHYLGHPNAVASVWRDLSGVSLPRVFSSGAKAYQSASAKPVRRALLVGINDYPDPQNRLEGCVNDVFLMSSVLQESTFEPDEIRVVLNERATAAAILDRLHWLLDDVKAGDERVLFYSGHGAQIPAYGPNDEPDHVNECLVPYDFDWTPERAITDKQFLQFYAQLPYESRFVAIFDCCHSGGMTREGGHRVRGLTPPDDIRHRALKWNPNLQVWEERVFAPLNESLATSAGGKNYLGENGATARLGRAAALRTLSNAEYNKTRRALGHHGPYLPIILEACQERELSYEYRHGATSYGAYTYSLSQVLRGRRQSGRNLTFAALNERTSEQLQHLKYDQHPNLVGPRDLIDAHIPWSAARPRPGRKGQTTVRQRPSRKRRARAAS